MNLLKGATCLAVIAASVVYLNNQYAEHKAREAAVNLAAIQLCQHKRAEAASYQGSMGWTMKNVTYKTGDEYCQ